METMIIINGSPRAPRSNSRQYAKLFSENAPFPCLYREIRQDNHHALCDEISKATQILLVFPLYADGIPSSLLEFLKTLSTHSVVQKPPISVLVNCGFLEPEQNNTAVEMIRLFCSQNGYPFGSVLKIGSGEAILSTPFRPFVTHKLKKLAKKIKNHQQCILQVTMPLTKQMFLRASTQYWIKLGEKNRISKEEMSSLDIE